MLKIRKLQQKNKKHNIRLHWTRVFATKRVILVTLNNYAKVGEHYIKFNQWLKCCIVIININRFKTSLNC